MLQSIYVDKEELEVLEDILINSLAEMSQGCITTNQRKRAARLLATVSRRLGEDYERQNRDCECEVEVQTSGLGALFG